MDENFTFNFAQFDQLDFNEENLDNQLTALFAYYAYLIIGLDLDTFAPMGGEDVLQRCMNLTNNAQNLSYPGWKAFDDNRNRYAIIADYLDGGMQPLPTDAVRLLPQRDSTRWPTMPSEDARRLRPRSKPI